MNEPDSSSAVVSAKDLSKVFYDFWHRPKVQAVDSISFDIRPGEVFGLLGPNGSGKSTTIKMALGLLFPTEGELNLFGLSPRNVKTKERIGYLPEESYLYPYLTAEETLQFYANLFSMPSAETKDRIEQLLSMMGLQQARHRKVGEFSKGMMRRIGLAQSIINDPDLVILDEPTSGLDPIGVRQVKDLILHLSSRGKTVLLSSHLLADVEDVCDRIAILYNGKIQARGSIQELLEDKKRQRFTVDDLTPDQMTSALKYFREELQQDPDIDHPRRNLEQFFLEVVEKARKENPLASGVGAAADVETFMSKKKDS